MATAATRATHYKGKVTNRSWPQLPEELVRHIATFYLWELSATAYCSQTWDTREHWYQRIVYTTLRDANELEKHMMDICPQWHLALQQHLFWQKAVALIDPNDVLAHYAVIHPKNVSLNSSSTPAHPTRLSPHRHFRNITQCSCLVCRINSPGSNNGLTNAKTQTYTPYLVKTGLCRDHGRRPASFCGLCLRDAPIFEHIQGGADTTAQLNMIAVIENEDKESFPNVEATCRNCRAEWLWRRVCENPRDREAIGGRTMCSEDWETRTTVDSFIDLAEGSIKEVIMLAKEKYWLRMNTRLTDMLEQALAASRYNRSRSYDAEEQEEEEEEEEDEDLELMQMEENGVRELALGDWARLRIMDGHWFSPADFWYNNALPGKPMHVHAVHPCPWSRDTSSSGSPPSAVEEEEEEEHPRPSTVKGEMPPTFSLCEQAFLVHQRQLRAVLIPAMRNLVRKIVIECATGLGGKIEDPAIRAARTSMEDVLTELREEEGLWFEGFDWVERRMNDRREREKRERDASGDDSSTASSGSRSSNGTSPVLSTSTLQTTPSPPPIPTGDEKEDAGTEQQGSSETPTTRLAKTITIPIAPVLDPPKLLPSIPYVPVTASHFPQYTLDALRMVWREACAPLYHCRCAVCHRASAKANAVSGDAPQQEQGQVPPVIVVPPQAANQPRGPAPLAAQPDVTIKLEDTRDADGDGEDELELIEEEDSEDEMEETDNVDEYIVSGSEDEEWYTPKTSTPQAVVVSPAAPPLPTVVLRPRKRSNDEIEREHHEEHERTRKRVSPGKGQTTVKGGTPPKRARRDDPPHFKQGGRLAPVQDKPPLPRRMRKRSSEDLEEVSEVEAAAAAGNKRIKMSPGALSSTPPSVIGVGESPPPSTTTTDLSRASSVSLSN